MIFMQLHQYIFVGTPIPGSNFLFTFSRQVDENLSYSNIQNANQEIRRGRKMVQKRSECKRIESKCRHFGGGDEQHNSRTS